MKSPIKTLKKKNLFTFVGIFLVLWLGWAYWESLRLLIKQFLTSGWFYFFAWATILPAYILHLILVRIKGGKNKAILSNSLPPFLDNCFGAVTYITIITTAFTLIKGLYLQQVFGQNYFNDFGSIDIVGLGFVIFFLKWYAFSKVYSDVKDVFYNEHTVEVAEIEPDVERENLDPD